MDVVTFMAPLWRLAGNPAFEQSQQLIFDRSRRPACSRSTRRIANANGGWEYTTARCGSAAGRRSAAVARDASRALAINSYQHAAGGVTLPLSMSARARRRGV
jgi:hypothetical protein